MPKYPTGSSRVTRPAPKNTSKTTQQERMPPPGGPRPGRTAPRRPRWPDGDSPARRRRLRPPSAPGTACWPPWSPWAWSWRPSRRWSSSRRQAVRPTLPPARRTCRPQATGSTDDAGTTTLSPAVLAALSVPASTLDAVGSPSSDVLPSRTSGNAAIGRGSDGKPLVTYVGAEYCPYCAAERWAVAVALSRFGTFSGLSGTHSSSSDVYPDTQTLSFYGSSYSSAYVDFQPVEEATNQEVGGTYPTLQTPTAAQSHPAQPRTTNRAASRSSTSPTGTSSPAPATPPRCCRACRSRRSRRSWTTRRARWPRPSTARRTTSRRPSAPVTGNQPSSVCDSPAIAAIAKTLGAS